MNKFQIFLLGAITALTGMWFIIGSSYVALVVSYGWTSILIFPLLYGFLAWLVVYAYSGSQISLDIFIEKKIKIKWVKNFLFKLFKSGGLIALLVSAFLLCPLVTPILVKLYIENERMAYIVAISLNVFSTIILTCFYILGW